MKVLIIGVGGLGSWLVDLFQHGYDNEQIPLDYELHIADPDTVEIKNIKFQNFVENDIMDYKTAALRKRYNCIAGTRTVEVDTRLLKNYDFFIIAADNFKIRQEVFEHCHKYKKEYIDLRAEGRLYMAKVKELNLADDLNTIDIKDTAHGSCQRQEDLDYGRIQYSNRIVSAIGFQMFLNWTRNITNKTIIQII